MIKQGQQAPQFSALDQDGKKHALSDFVGKNVVLYFYPQDNTPGCTREALGFSQKKAEFDEKNAVIIGVSTQGVASHQTFCVDHGLAIILLADETGDIAQQYGVLGENGKAERTTFIIDIHGSIKNIFSPVSVDGHTDAVLNTLGAISYCDV